MTDERIPRFGRPEEWAAFALRNPVFIARFHNLEQALNTVFCRTITPRSNTDTVVWHLSRLCAEDFMEILLLVGNGYGFGAQRLLRSLYERAVTARYLTMHPDLTDKFIEFGKADLYKMVQPIRVAVGKQLIPDDVIRDLKEARDRLIAEQNRGFWGLRRDFWHRIRGRNVRRRLSRWSGNPVSKQWPRKPGTWAA